LPRTVKTFENIRAEHPGLPEPVLLPLLREKSGGPMEGRPILEWDRLAKQFEAQRKGTYREFKAPGAESWTDVFARAQEFLDLLLK
jgi:broad specificity phosphatase PhoE